MSLPVHQPPLTLGGKPDQLFATGPYPRPFEFNHEVAQVFDDMVSRSVPMYREVNLSLVEWAYLYYQEGTALYDLGCSTGTTLLAIGSQLPHRARLLGIDNSPAMLAQAQTKLAPLASRHEIELLCASALEITYQPASVVILNYTLQFIPVQERPRLLAKVFAAMAPGGIVYISEKVRSPCPEFQETITRVYENFKLRAGYSETEIARKKEALDQVLIPLTLDEQITMILKAGFSHCEPVMKWNNFVSLVAIKK